MMNLQDKVWYACYGSNVLADRFLCYIVGGQPNGAKNNYAGCEDKTLPTEDEEFYISSELYFAKESRNWQGGGVAFVRTLFQPAAMTMGRMYLVTKAQLVDIARQETNTEAGLTIDFDKAISEGYYIFKSPSWYGNLLYLGGHRDYPIFTLTNENDLQPFTKPSENYIKTIGKGIKEAHDFDDLTITEYLINKGGIHGNYSTQEILDIIRK